MTKLSALLFGFFLAPTLTLNAQTSEKPLYKETHRPQFHYTPKKNWMNDPNGMIYVEGEYHLFYQHDNYDKVFGNMSWGHAVSMDLVHWKELPKAIVPDNDGLGLIFSGSAVLDKNNSAGFGANALVAFYTSTNPQQQQSMAYSTDKGRTWTKYKGNPIIKNEKDDAVPDDFRDPKVMWHEDNKKWVMSLAVNDHIEFWSSTNLKTWTKESEFGQSLGSHDGVWECPDLFELKVDGSRDKKWVLLVSMNPGGPNGGSATQYFVGHFDGKEFKPKSTETRWIDYGTDNYAGVTFFNTGDRKIAMGWMNNWQYAGMVPTQGWRGAMTLPRELGLKPVKDKLFLTSVPVNELKQLVAPAFSKENLSVNRELDLSSELKDAKGRFKLDISLTSVSDFSINLSNDKGEELIIGYEKATNQYFIDRTNAGESAFEKGFAKRHTAPRISTSDTIDLSLYIDAASAEVFADKGLNVFTDTFFPNSLASTLKIKTPNNVQVSKLQLSEVKSIW